VAAVDHRNGRILGCKASRAVARVPYDHDVGVVRDHSNRVGEAFPLGGGAGRWIGAGNGLAAEADHCTFEGKPGARARPIEQAGQDVIRCDGGTLSDAVTKVRVWQLIEIGLSRVEYILDLLVAEIVDGNDVTCGRIWLRRHSRTLRDPCGI